MGYRSVSRDIFHDVDDAAAIMWTTVSQEAETSQETEANDTEEDSQFSEKDENGKVWKEMFEKRAEGDGETTNNNLAVT